MRPNEKLHEVLFSDDEERTTTSHELVSRVQVPSLNPERLAEVDPADPASMERLTQQSRVAEAAERNLAEASQGLDGVVLERPASD